MTDQIHDPSADQEFPFDGSAAASRFWTEANETAANAEQRKVQPHPGLIGRDDFPIHMFAGAQIGQDGNTKGDPEIVRMVDHTKTPVAHYAVGENGELEALPMPDRRFLADAAEELADDPIFTRFDNPFALALEQAVADADLAEHDTGRTPREIAAEILKHPSLENYFAPDHEAYSESEAFEQQFNRYAETDAQLCDLADGAADLSEAEWLGNVAPLPYGEQLTKEQAREQWNQHRRPQLMAIAKAGLDAIQELSGMQAELKGFHEDRPVESGPALQHWQGNKLMLIVSEAVEAHDEIRNGHPAYHTYYPSGGTDESGPGPWKPEGVPSEIADVIVRCADFAWTEGFDLSQIVIEKLEYNNTRPHKHGKGF